MRAFTLLLALAILGACGDKPAQSPATLQWPDLARFDPSVTETLAEARARFEQARAANGGAVPAASWADLGKTYQAHHLYELAEQCYRNALQLDRSEIRWHYYLGFVLQETGRFDAAIAEYTTFIDATPDYLPARLRLAESLFASGKMQQARSSWEAVLNIEPANAAALAGLGQVALAEGQYQQAAQYLERALQQQPAATRLYHPLAMALRGRGDATGAAAALQRRGDRKALYNDPLLNEVSALSRSAQYYLVPALKAAQAGRHAEAAELFRKVLEIDPDDAAAHAALARVLESLGDLDASLRETQTALALDPNLTVARYQLGVLHERLGDDSVAIPAYRQVLENEPDYAEPRFLLANALMRSGDYQGAASQYETLHTLMPANVRVLYRLGLARLAGGDCKGAIEPLEKASDLNESFGPVVEALVRVYSSCSAASDAQRIRALADGRWLFEQLPSPGFAEALAMALARNSLWADALDLQAQVLKQVAGDEAVQAFREANLLLYKQQQSARRAWPAGASVFKPPAISAQQRGGVN